MFFAVPVLIYSLLFLLGLEASVFNSGWFDAVSVILVIFSWLGTKKISTKLAYLNLPVFFAVASLALLYLIDSFLEKQIFIVLGTALYYLGLLSIYRFKDYAKDQTARGMMAASALTAIFFFYSSAYGIYINFQVSLWALMAMFFLATLALSYTYFSTLKEDNKLVWSYGVVIGLAMTEVAWSINFWPFGYLTTGVITLMLYYVFWDLVQSYFLNLLSKKRLTANLVLFSILIGIVLASSKWLPAV
jgi:hypothetical protein